MRRILSAMALSMALSAAPAFARNESQPTQAEDIAAVRAIGESWKQLYQASRFSEIPDLYAQDTVVMPRGRPRIEGREQMRKAIGGLAAGRRVDIDVTERELKVIGDYAWFQGDFRVTYLSPEANVAPKTEYGRSFILYRRDADGRWRILRDIDSPSPPPGTPVQAAPMAAPPAAAPAKAANAPAAPKIWNPASCTAATKCDQLTASRYNRTRLAKPVAREDIDVPAAIKKCEADLVTYPDDPRILFQLGRLYGYAGEKEKTLAARKAAAAAGNHNAIFFLAYLDWTAAKDAAAFFLEGRFAPCADAASAEQVAAYVKAARPVADGFFETRFAEHLEADLAREQSAQTSAAGGGR